MSLTDPTQIQLAQQKLAQDPVQIEQWLSTQHNWWTLLTTLTNCPMDPVPADIQSGIRRVVIHYFQQEQYSTALEWLYKLQTWDHPLMAAIVQTAQDLEKQQVSLDIAMRLREAVLEWDPNNGDNLLALVTLASCLKDDWRVLIHTQAAAGVIQSNSSSLKSTYQFCFETPLKQLLKNGYYNEFFELSNLIIDLFVPEEEKREVYVVLSQVASFYHPSRENEYEDKFSIADLFTKRANDTLSFLFKGSTLKGYSIIAEKLEALASRKEEDPLFALTLLCESIHYYNQSADQKKTWEIINKIIQDWPLECLSKYIPQSKEESEELKVNSLFQNFSFRVCFHLSYLTDDRHFIRNYQRISDRGRSRIYYFVRPELARSKESYKEHLLSLSLSSRPLRVGYIGLCFGMHSVGFLSYQAITQHDPSQVSFICYLVGSEPDENDFIYQEFKRKSYLFHDLREQPWGVVLKKILADDLDILVLMDASTSAIGFQILPYRPAPIQMSWLGGDAPSIPELDYFIVDPYILPEDADADYDETLLRLLTFSAVDSFQVGAIEPQKTRQILGISDQDIIFWSAANATKRNPDSIQAHLEILKGVPDSVLVIKGLGDFSAVQEAYSTKAEVMGIRDRLKFVLVSSLTQDHRAQLSVADLVLDTFPYTGATHTFEALYVGTPVLTLVGRHYYGRMSYSLLKNCELDDCITYTQEEYIQRGIALGIDRERLAKVKSQLQASRQTSPIWDAKGFARNLEAAYRQVINDQARQFQDLI